MAEHANFTTKFEDGIYLVSHAPEKKYKELELIGKGGNGVVVKAQRLSSGEVVAIKKVAVHKTKASLHKQLLEIEILASLQDSPFIVGYKECLFIKHKFISELFDKNLRDDRQLWCIMELCGKDIYHTMDVLERPLKMEELRSVTAQVVSALQYIHSKKIVHRDIKGLNILTTSSGCIKVCDFGASEIAHTSGHDQLKNVVTSLWMAPEMFTDEAVYQYEVDIWGLGITVIEMFRNRVPFQEHQQTLVWASIRNLTEMDEESRRYALEIPKPPKDVDLTNADLETQMYEFIFRCLTCEQSLRPTVSELMQDPFISPVMEELTTLEESAFILQSNNRSEDSSFTCEATFSPLRKLYEQVEEALK